MPELVGRLKGFFAVKVSILIQDSEVTREKKYTLLFHNGSCKKMC